MRSELEKDLLPEENISLGESGSRERRERDVAQSSCRCHHSPARLAEDRRWYLLMAAGQVSVSECACRSLTPSPRTPGFPSHFPLTHPHSWRMTGRLLALENVDSCCFSAVCGGNSGADIWSSIGSLSCTFHRLPNG